MNPKRLRASVFLPLILSAGACGRPDIGVESCPRVYSTPVADTMVVRAGPARGEMGKHLQVGLRMPVTRPDLAKLRLFIDGHPVPELPARQIGARCALRDSTGAVMGFQEVYEFVPVRTDSSRDMWAHLLGSPEAFRRTVRVGAGLANGPEFKSLPDSANVTFTVAEPWATGLVAVLLAGLLVLVVILRKTSLLRDPYPVPPSPSPAPPADPVAPAVSAPVSTPRPPPYSLAKVVMLMWTLLILASFFGIWLITGDYRGILTPQSLVLLGIVGASGAVSVAMTQAKNQAVTKAASDQGMEVVTEAEKEKEAEERNLALQGGEPPPSPAPATERAERLVWAGWAAAAAMAPRTRGFWTDLLSDQNGPTVHRFQNLVWNVSLAVVFIVGVYRTLALPEFDGNLLLLMGISQGLYLGVKVSEDPKPPTNEPQAESRMAALLRR